MGFDVERFLEPVDDDLKCGICFGVLEEPLATPCGHVYCAQCIVQWTAESGTCPLTCEQISVDDLKKILPLTSLIAKQNIRCENFRRGCAAILKVENIQSHLLKCHYVKANTSGGRIMDRRANSPETREFSRVVVCEKGCGLPLLYQDSSTHDCIKALQSQVASLQMKLTRAEHEKEMACERIAKREEAMQDRILNLENELHSYQIQVLNFERQLKEYRLQVGYLQKQLDVRGDQAAEEIEVEVVLARAEGSLGFNIMGGSEVGSNSVGGGIVVSRVADGGPASKDDGLKAQDRILKVNGIDLSEASHATAVETIKSAVEPLHILVKRKCGETALDCLPSLASTGTQTDLCLPQELESVDTDSGIHDRYSPRQDMLNPFEKSLDDGTSSSECSHRRIDCFSRDDLENLRSTSESLPSSENIVYSEQGTLPRVTLMVKDVSYVRDIEGNTNIQNQGQPPYVTAVSDELYFDPELDYEYEEITLWIANSDLGLTFCCGEEDESTVYVCEIEPGSVAYLDGRLTLWDQVLKINDVPVSHISDIEPLVYESSATIKFLVARPAQEVQATLVGSEGSQSWSFNDPMDGDLNDFGIGIIKEEDEDGTDTVNSEKTSGDKCEKDSGVGKTDDSTKNDESSEPDLGEEALPETDTCRKNSSENINNNNNKLAKESGNSCERKSSSSSRSKEERAFSPIRSAEDNSANPREQTTASEKDSSRNNKDSSRENSNSRRHNGGSPNKSCLSPTRNGGSPPRKDKDKNKGERKKGRESSHKDGDECKGERERSRHSDQKRNGKLGNVSRTIRASYIKAMNKDSIQHINMIGETEVFGGKSESRSGRKKASSGNDNQSLNGSQQNMEWKVRMSKDGSQIFVRKRSATPARQARNKLLRDRAQKITDERKGMTTDDDTQTIYQGRYWPREDRRRHLERVREARRKKIQKLQQMQKESESPHTGSGSESGKGRRDIIVEMSQKKLNKKREPHFDDFTTVQEYLTQRNPDGSPVGPIHVTTV